MYSITRPLLTAAALVLAVLASCPPQAFGSEHTGMEREIDLYGEVARMGSSTGVSLAPILAYEPTFGTIYGGAIFLQKAFAPRYAFNSRLAFSTEGEYSVLFNIKKYFSLTGYFHLEAEVDDFARPYYGEGMETSASRRILIEGTTSRLLYFLKFGERGKVSVGAFLDFRGAEYAGVDGTEVPRPAYDEATLGFGMSFFYDARDSGLSPTTGVYDALTVRYVPESLSTYKGVEEFGQAEVDHRIFWSPAPGTVLAGRLHLATSLGDPSYQYRYSLGGPYELRGFYTNRFRGHSLWSAQLEVRQNLFWIFSGAAFAEAGEVADESFGTPETSFGGGLRMTLPPDHIAKARLDFAWGRDQKSIYFIFGEAF